MSRPYRGVRQLAHFNDYSPAVWRQLSNASDAPSLFLTLAWQRVWWKIFGRGTLLLLALEQEGQPLALAPFFADAGMVFFIGAGSSDYLDFLGCLAAPEDLDLLLMAARDRTPGFLGFRLHHIRASSPTGPRLQEAAARLGFDWHDEGDIAAPVLRFADWPAGRRPPEQKKSLVRHERFFSRQGPVDVEHCCTPDAIEPHLDDFFDQHIRRWQDSEFPSLFLQQKQREFYRALVRDRQSQEWLRFSRIAWDGTPLAFHLGGCFSGAYLWYKPSFEIRLARQSPGEVLIRHLLIAAQREGAEVFDFGIGDEDFKRRFSTATPVVRTWGLYPRG